jgi:hypothetical protein
MGRQYLDTSDDSVYGVGIVQRGGENSCRFVIDI